MVTEKQKLLDDYSLCLFLLERRADQFQDILQSVDVSHASVLAYTDWLLEFARERLNSLAGEACLSEQFVPRWLLEMEVEADKIALWRYSSMLSRLSRNLQIELPIQPYSVPSLEISWDTRTEELFYTIRSMTSAIADRALLCTDWKDDLVSVHVGKFLLERIGVLTSTLQELEGGVEFLDEELGMNTMEPFEDICTLGILENECRYFLMI